MLRMLTLMVLAGALATSPSMAEDAADLILQHGRFHSVSSPTPLEGSLVVKDGRIAYLGADVGAQAYRGPATELVDLGGRTVTPGLIDAHSHLMGLGTALVQVDLVGTASYGEVIERVAAASRRLKGLGNWGLGN